MHREIKFRVWDHFNNQFIGYDPLNGSEISISLDGRLIISSRDGFYNLEEKIHSIQQFTGYLDKNGKEIYQGDIVKTDPNHITLALTEAGEYTNGVIEWVNTGFNICQSYMGRTLMEEYIVCDCCPCGLEIIGNIFETPELKSKLKEKDESKI